MFRVDYFLLFVMEIQGSGTIFILFYSIFIIQNSAVFTVKIKKKRNET